jgi:hypothetical protein
MGVEERSTILIGRAGIAKSLGKIGGMVCTGLNWLRIETNNGML